MITKQKTCHPETKMNDEIKSDPENMTGTPEENKEKNKEEIKDQSEEMPPHLQALFSYFRS